MNRLQVYMNGDKVGYFDQNRDGSHQFTYASEWLDSPHSRPVSLSLPLRLTAYTGAEVINFFDNLLPDNPRIRDRIAARFQSKTTRVFDLLAEIGRDAAGAIMLLPESDQLPDYQTIQATALSEEELERVLSGYKNNAPLGMLDGNEDFRISVAGAQEKTALLYHQDRWYLPHRITPTTHIIKLPIGQIHTQQHTLDLSRSVDNELICLTLASEFGLPAVQASILHAGEQRALCVKRFDRRLSKDGCYFLRLPHEDFCQTFGLPPSAKYENDGGIGIQRIMQERLLFSENKQDRRTFMATQVFFWLLAAIDGHAKNFSLSIEAQGRFRLAPLYDILSA
ncbi:MAG: HipA domain-containing protein, partial [Neisseria sp.]|nr:HipA domain-containing protein [Neisseria sp.]